MSDMLGWQPEMLITTCIVSNFTISEVRRNSFLFRAAISACQPFRSLLLTISKGEGVPCISITTAACRPCTILLARSRKSDVPNEVLVLALLFIISEVGGVALLHLGH